MSTGLTWRSATIIIVCATACGLHAKVDSIYFAVETRGVRLYWVPEAGLSPDTVGWAALAGPLPESRYPALVDLLSVARELDSTGWKLFRVKNCSAMGLALLAELGYPVAVLCQWSASLRNKVRVAKPGMPVRAMQHSLVSDFLWETVERTIVESLGGGGDFRICVYLAGRGQSWYDGRDAVVGANRQAAGIDGVVVRIPELSYEADLNIRRTAYAICVVTPSNITAQNLAAGVERAMDRRKLSLSYTVPQFEEVRYGSPVKAGSGVVSCPAAAVLDSTAPAVADSAVGPVEAPAGDTGHPGGMDADSLP